VQRLKQPPGRRAAYTSGPRQVCEWEHARPWQLGSGHGSVIKLQIYLSYCRYDGACDQLMCWPVVSYDHTNRLAYWWGQLTGCVSCEKAVISSCLWLLCSAKTCSPLCFKFKLVSLFCRVSLQWQPVKSMDLQSHSRYTSRTAVSMHYDSLTSYSVYTTDCHSGYIRTRMLSLALVHTLYSSGTWHTPRRQVVGALIVNAVVTWYMQYQSWKWVLQCIARWVFALLTVS